MHLFGVVLVLYIHLLSIVTIITLTLALTCTLNSVSATCWGSCNWLVHLTRNQSWLLETQMNSYPFVIIITLTLALTCPLNSVSATCWGNCNWHNHITRRLDLNKLRLPLMETLMIWIHKCFPLGLFWFCEVIFYMLSLFITLALTCPVHWVSLTCWGIFNW